MFSAVFGRQELWKRTVELIEHIPRCETLMHCISDSIGHCPTASAFKAGWSSILQRGSNILDIDRTSGQLGMGCMSKSSLFNESLELRRWLRVDR